MYNIINLNTTQSVDINFTENNINSILKKCKTRDIPKEDYEKIETGLNLLHDVFCNFQVDAMIDEIDLDEDVIDEAYSDLHGDSTYDDGVNDACNNIRKYKLSMKQKHGMLLYKLDKLAYNYGKQESLTKDEIKTIKELLDYEYGKLW